MKTIPKKYKGLGLHLYCYKCQRQITSKCQESRRIADNCEFKDRWIYKMIIHVPVPGTRGTKRTKVCQARDIESAVIELHSFKKSINKNLPSRSNNSQQRHVFLSEGIERYFQKIHSEGEFARSSKPLSKDHQKDCVRVIERFVESIRRSGRMPEELKLSDLDESYVRPFYELIDKYVKSNSGRDRHTRIMRSFFEFLINRGMYKGANFFKTVDTHSIQVSPTAISDKELQLLLKAITPENAWGIKGSGRKKNFYRKWLIDLIELARYTGLRKEELFELSFSNIETLESGHRLLIVHNLKVERLLNKESVLKVIPITQKLRILLEKLELNRVDGQDKLIETGMKWGAYKDFVSRAFTHFYRKAFPDAEVKHFKQLRKSHITEIHSLLGQDAYKVTGHSGEAVLNKNYIDKVQAAIQLLELE